MDPEDYSSSGFRNAKHGGVGGKGTKTISIYGGRSDPITGFHPPMDDLFLKSFGFVSLA